MAFVNYSLMVAYTTDWWCPAMLCFSHIPRSIESGYCGEVTGVAALPIIDFQFRPKL